MLDIRGIKVFKGVEDLQVEILEFTDKNIKYKVSNTPICQYDQHSRARVGIQFKEYTVSKTPEYVVYSALYERLKTDTELQDKFQNTATKLEVLRNASDIKDDYNLMSRNCSYVVVQDFDSLRGQMSRRLKFCEEEFIVALHWLLRDKMIKAGIKIAETFKPGCDGIGKCDYAAADYLSNAFGCLFAGCNRWPSHAQYASFNQSCTTPKMLEEQLGLEVFKSKYEMENNIR
jgi:hypothetical protein